MRRSTALTVALRHLRQMLRAPHASAPALPSVHSLATSAGVSHPTMLKAIHVLVDLGVLTARQGSRCRISGDESAIASFVKAGDGDFAFGRLRHDEVREWLTADIVRGLYRAGEPLPLPKELRARYGVCHRTLAKALDRLLSEGRIERHNRRYLLPRPRSSLPGNRVVLFARGRTNGTLTFYVPGERDRFRALEHDCAQMGMSLHAVACHYEGAQMTYVGKGKNSFGTLRAGDEAVLGFMVWAGDLDEQLCDLLNTTLPQYGKPMAVLNDRRLRPSCVRHGSGAITRHFAFSTGGESGRAVGRYLFALGHRAVAYLSIRGEEAWSVNRFEGLRAAMTEGDPNCVVRQFAISPPGEVETIVDSSMRIRRDLRSAVSVTLSPLPNTGGRRESLEQMMRVRLRELYDRESMRARIRPVLEQAIRFKEATAWAGANDWAALDAMEYLRRHGRRVPRDTSVVGFDDLLEASIQGLTSYNFNGAAVMHAMLLHLTDPHHGPAAANPSRPFEVPGVITMRQTTAPPP
jgi:DNA-binding transcriptional regulator YhcF (GntR family)